MAGSKAAANPDSLNAAISRALAGHIADQVGMRTMLEQPEIDVSHGLSLSFWS
jgi:hypothetical protein